MIYIGKIIADVFTQIRILEGGERGLKLKNKYGKSLDILFTWMTDNTLIKRLYKEAYFIKRDK